MAVIIISRIKTIKAYCKNFQTGAKRATKESLKNKKLTLTEPDVVTVSFFICENEKINSDYFIPLTVIVFKQ